jgi:hypothetical protein
MAMTDHHPFSPEALAANGSGRLTDEQTRHWQQFARQRRNGRRGASGLVAAFAAVLLIAHGPASSAATREAVGLGCLALAAGIFVTAGRDTAMADVRAGRVDVVEGAIGKRVVRAHGPSSGNTYYFDIGDRHLRTSRAAYDAAPDAGIVRVYYLPRSGRVVNLERLPNRPLPTGPGAAREILENVVGAMRRHDRGALAEAGATVAAVADAIRGPLMHSGDGGSDCTRSHLTDDAMCGTWTNPLITITFARDGTASVSAVGRTRHVARWSIDARGRLLTDATGTMQPADAEIAGDQLRIALDGQQMAFTRVAQ